MSVYLLGNAGSSGMTTACTHFVMGLLMWENLLGFLDTQDGGAANPVPHLGGVCLAQWPLEGSICLRVDHCSQREDGAELWTRCSSAVLEKDLRGASERGTQWEGREARLG